MKWSWMVLLLLVGCGDDSPFDEDYWDTDNDIRNEEERRDTGRYTANLTPVSALGFGNGSVALDIDGNNAFIRIEVNNIPQNLRQGHVELTTTPCNGILTNPPTTGTPETKNFTYTENGTRAGLFRDITDGTIEGTNLVLYAYATQPGGGASTLFPLACGVVTRAGDSTPTTTSGTGGGTLTGGSTGSIGGTTSGTTAGTTAGTVGGTTAGTTSGTTGETTGGIPGGVTTGTGDGGETSGTTFGGTLGGFSDGNEP